MRSGFTIEIYFLLIKCSFNDYVNNKMIVVKGKFETEFDTSSGEMISEFVENEKIRNNNI